MRPQDQTGRRLGHALLAYLGVVLAVVTLSPFRFEFAPVNSLSWVLRPFDVVMNVVIFVPIGFVYRLSRARTGRAVWIQALALGAAVSALVESAQIFAPERYPSVVDLVTNTAGALMGSWLGGATLRRADGAAAVRTFAVELPLMGLVYLLVPLAWLIGVDPGINDKAWLLFPLAASAGWIISSAFTSFENAPRARVLYAATAWMLVALTPAAVRVAGTAGAAAAVGTGAAWVRCIVPARFTHEAGATSPSRRFEGATLRLVFPLFVLYVLASSLLPVSGLRAEWTGTLALLPRGTSTGLSTIFAALAHLSAFTVLGYAIAEYLGRVHDQLDRIVPAVVAWAALLSGVVELARGWHPHYAASAALFAVTLASAVFGCFLYTLQLAHVRALVRGPR